jgi:UDP-glucose 4-epimerase
MRILITGAAGFIGTHLTDALQKMDFYVVPTDDWSHYTSYDSCAEYLDVRDQSAVLWYAKTHKPDMIVHLAALISTDESMVDPDRTLDVNVRGTLNVLRAARRVDAKVVFASTSEVYGTYQYDSEDDGAINESHPMDGHYPYAASKIAADRLCRSWNRCYGLDVAIVRGFNTYGPWQRQDGYGGVIAKFVDAALKGEPIEIYGDGEQKRDWMYIDDCIKAYKCVINGDHWNAVPVNFGSGRAQSVNDVARIVQKLVQGPLTIERVMERPGDVRFLLADIGRAKEMYGWEPKWSLEQGLKRYYAWCQERRKEDE